MKNLFIGICIIGLSGCATRSERTSIDEERNTFIRDFVALMSTPEADPTLFADSIPRPFRAAALQACQFRRRYGRWPFQRQELEREFGSFKPQSYHIAVGLNGDLVLSWQTSDGPGDTVLRISKDYVIRFSLVQAIDAAVAAREKAAATSNLSAALGIAVGRL